MTGMEFTTVLLLTLWGFIVGIEPWFGSPIGLYFGIITSVVAGIIAGNPVVGAICGATLFLAFLGVVSLGGAAVPEQRTAAVVIPPIVIATGIDPIKAVPLAWAVAVLGSYFYTLAMTANVGFAHLADKYAEEGNWRGVEISNLLGLIPHGLAVAVPVFIFSYFGADFVNLLVKTLPSWIWTGLGAAGAVMTSLGVALLLNVVWKKEYTPILLLGFSLVAYLNLSLIGLAIVGLSLIWLFYFMTGKAEALMETLKSQSPSREKKLTGKDITNAFWRSWFLQNNLNWERLEGIGFAFGILPILKKLYSGDELKKRVKNHLQFYNTTPYTHNIILGLTIALEEENADIDTISSVKASLMGPLAGIGDTIFWFTLATIIGGIGASILQQGLVWGALVTLILWISIMWPLKYYFTKISYERGLTIAEMLTGPFMSEIKMLLTNFGLIMIGGIIASFLSIKTPLAWEFAGLSVQKLLDSIMPKMLPLLFALFNVFLLRKGIKPLALVLILFVLGFILGVLGIISP
jgi:PTS system mannose-specific IID component